MPWRPGFRGDFQGEKHGGTVDGSEIRRSPVEVGSLSHHLQGLHYIPGGCLGFRPSTGCLEKFGAWHFYSCTLRQSFLGLITSLHMGNGWVIPSPWTGRFFQTFVVGCSDEMIQMIYRNIPLGLEYQGKVPGWEIHSSAFFFSKKRDHWKSHSPFFDLMRLSDIQTWFNMQDATKNTSLSLNDKKDVSKKHTQTVCVGFSLMHFSVLASLCGFFWDPRCAKPIMSSWFMSRRERWEGASSSWIGC